jgi:hypothetical protein
MRTLRVVFFISKTSRGFAQQNKRPFNLVRILPPPRLWIEARLGHSNPQCFGDPARLEKRLEFRCATRNTSAARRHAPSCMGATELQSNWPEMRKTLGKPLVLQRRGQEPNFSWFPDFFGTFERQPGGIENSYNHSEKSL